MNVAFLPKTATSATPIEPPVVLKIPPRVVDGRSLAHLIAGKSPVERACIAAKHRSALVRLTIKQWAMITGASHSYVHAAIKLSGADLRQVTAGIRPMILPTRHPAPKSDATVLADIVARRGVDATLELIVAAEVAAAA